MQFGDKACALTADFNHTACTRRERPHTRNDGGNILHLGKLRTQRQYRMTVATGYAHGGFLRQVQAPQTVQQGLCYPAVVRRTPNLRRTRTGQHQLDRGCAEVDS